MCTNDTAVNSEVTVHVYYCKFQSVFVLKYNCSIFLSPKNMHIYCCRTYCNSIYTFIIFTVMAGWHQGNSTRICCKLMKFQFSAVPQCLSPPAQRRNSPSCRLSVAVNQTLLVFSFQAKFQVGCIFISVSWQVYPRLDMRSCPDPTPSVGHVTGGHETT